MDILKKCEAIKLRSHLDKYMVADDDREKIRQSRRSANSLRAIWLVEYTTKPNTIRLKNYNTGLYLTASDIPFLLGMTGKKVIQSSILNNENSFDFNPSRYEWLPIRDGFQVKFKTVDGKFLRGNGSSPPWRNTVTTDIPLTGGTYNWLLWDVEPFDLSMVGNLENNNGSSKSSSIMSPMSSFTGSEVDDDFGGGNGSGTDSPAANRGQFCNWSPSLSMKKSAMDLFHNAKAVRLKSHHHKFLIAEDDEESVTQDRNGSAKAARWTVEFVDTADNIIRLKSCYGKYLTATNQPFLLGMTGHKILQSMPRRLDSSIEWEPVRDGKQVKLKTRYGNYLRANAGLPPWRNSVTHDVPFRSKTQDWIMWEVDIVEILEDSVKQEKEEKNEKVAKAAAAVVAPIKQQRSQEIIDSDSISSGLSTPSGDSGRFVFQRQESIERPGPHSPPKANGRTIYYRVAYDEHDVSDALEEYSFSFKGKSVKELTQKLEEENNLQDILVCTRSPLNGKLHPLRLQLPPNSTTMHVFVVPSSSILASDFEKMGLL